MDIQQHIAQLISDTIAGEPWLLSKNSLELKAVINVPKDRKMGDFAFPCFVFAKELGKGPPMIAKELLGPLSERVTVDKQLSKVEDGDDVTLLDESCDEVRKTRDREGPIAGHD